MVFLSSFMSGLLKNLSISEGSTVGTCCSEEEAPMFSTRLAMQYLLVYLCTCSARWLAIAEVDSSRRSECLHLLVLFEIGLVCL